MFGKPANIRAWADRRAEKPVAAAKLKTEDCQNKMLHRSLSEVAEIVDARARASSGLPSQVLVCFTPLCSSTVFSSHLFEDLDHTS